MKLVRFGNPGEEKPGLVDADGAIRDLSGHVSDFAGAALSPASLDKLRALDPKSLPLAPAGVRLGPPVAGTRNFIAVGLNFADHAKETKQEIPPEPILFSKAPNCIVGAYDDVMYPKNAVNMDWEVEIAFVVGTRARYVEEKDAMCPHRRLLHLQRRVRAPLPGEARRPVAQGQVGGDVRAAWALARHARRDPRRAEPRHVARRQRREEADGHDQDHDLLDPVPAWPTSPSSWCSIPATW